ncbi:MAG TPA: PRC-barrel domain-containing protein [Ktedonobacterales bacterium]
MAENPNRTQGVVEDIDTLMHVDSPVYDTYGQKVGTVKHFDLTAGYMQVYRGGLEPETFYIPFHLIASIDLRRISLTVSGATLTMQYTVLPASQAVLEEWTNWRTGQRETTVGQRMRSGSSGQNVEAFQQTYATLASQLRAGMRVHDIEGRHVATLQQFDSRHGWMLLVKAGPEIDVLVAPFSAVADVDTATYTVNLLVPKESLQGDLAALLPSSTAGDTSQPHADARDA